MEVKSEHIEIKRENEQAKDSICDLSEVSLDSNLMEEMTLTSDLNSSSDRETTKTILEDVCTDFESMDVIKIDKNNKIINIEKKRTAPLKPKSIHQKISVHSTSIPDMVPYSDTEQSSNSVFRVSDSNVLPPTSGIIISTVQSIASSEGALIQPPNDSLVAPNFIPTASTDTALQISSEMSLTRCEDQNISIVGFPNESIQSLAQLADAEIVQTADNSVSIIITNPRLIKVMTNSEDPVSSMIDTTGGVLEASFEDSEDLIGVDPDAFSNIEIQDINIDSSILDGNIIVQTESEVSTEASTSESPTKRKRGRGRPRRGFEVYKKEVIHPTPSGNLGRGKRIIKPSVYQPGPIIATKSKPPKLPPQTSTPHTGNLVKPRRISAKMKEAWSHQLHKKGQLICNMPGCSQSFVTVANFQTHYKFCTGKKTLEHCLYCDSLIFTTSKAVLQHMEVEHPDKVEEYKAKYPELCSEYDESNLPSQFIVSEDENVAMNVEEITFELQKNAKKRKLSSKENSLSAPKAILKHKMKAINETVNENIKEFKKCVRFDNIVDKINSIDDFSKVVENVSEQTQRLKKEKRKRVVISYVEEKKYFEDDEDDFITTTDNTQQSITDERIHTKARMVLNLEKYKRYKEYLKVTRDWSSERKTYSRSKGSDTSLESSYLLALQNEYIRDMQQLNSEYGSNEAANISLDYSQMDNSQIEINDMSSLETFQVIQTDKFVSVGPDLNFGPRRPNVPDYTRRHNVTSTPMRRNNRVGPSDISLNLNEISSISIDLPSTAPLECSKLPDPILRNRTPNSVVKRIPCYNRTGLPESVPIKSEPPWKREGRRNNIITYGVAIPPPVKKAPEPPAITFDSLMNSAVPKQITAPETLNQEQTKIVKKIINKREDGIKHPLKKRGRRLKQVEDSAVVLEKRNNVAKSISRNNNVKKVSASMLKNIQKNVRDRSAKLLKLKQTSKLKCDSRRIVRISQLRAKQQSVQRLQSISLIEGNEEAPLEQESSVQCVENIDNHISLTNTPGNIQCLAIDHNYSHSDAINGDPVNNVVREEEVISSNLEEINKNGQINAIVKENAAVQLATGDCIQEDKNASVDDSIQRTNLQAVHSEHSKDSQVFIGSDDSTKKDSGSLPMETLSKDVSCFTGGQNEGKAVASVEELQTDTHNGAAQNLESLVEPGNVDKPLPVLNDHRETSPTDIAEVKNNSNEKSPEEISAEIQEIVAEVDAISAKVQEISSKSQDVVKMAVVESQINNSINSNHAPPCEEINTDAEKSDINASANDKNIVQEVKVKRGRGRPRKNTTLEITNKKNIQDQCTSRAQDIQNDSYLNNVKESQTSNESCLVQNSMIDDNKPIRKSDRVKKRKLVDDETFELPKAEIKKKDENNSTVAVIRTGRRGRPRKVVVVESEANTADVQSDLQKISEQVVEAVTENISEITTANHPEVDAQNNLEKHSEINVEAVDEYPCKSSRKKRSKSYVENDLEIETETIDENITDSHKNGSEAKTKADRNLRKNSRKGQSKNNIQHNEMQKSSETEAKNAEESHRKFYRKVSKDDDQKDLHILESEVEASDDNLRKYSRKGRPRKCVRYADLNSGIDSSESLDGMSNESGDKEKKNLTAVNELQGSILKEKQEEAIVLPLKKRKQRQNKKDDVNPGLVEDSEIISSNRSKMNEVEIMDDEDAENIPGKTRVLRVRKVKNYSVDDLVDPHEKVPYDENFEPDFEDLEYTASNISHHSVNRKIASKGPINRRVTALLASKSGDTGFAKGSYPHPTKRLFAEFRPKKIMWQLLSDSDYLEYLPPLKNSVYFQIQRVSNSTKTLEDIETKWSSLSYLESLPLDEESCHGTFFTGGPVLCSAWCPTPVNEKKTQYIILAVRSSLNKFHSYFNTDTEKGLLQLWNVGLLTNNKLDSKPVMELGISHNHGYISGMAWCPGGCWEFPSMECSDIILPRLGMLAVACSDSYIRVYSVPHPESLPRKSTCYPLYSACPSIILKPMYGGTCLATMKSTCVSVTWQKTDNCERIAGGYGNGMICIWLINSSATILTSKGNGQTIISPYLIFNAHGTPVTSLSFSSVPGARFLLSSSADKTAKFWDLLDTSLPFFSVRKGASRSAKWSPGICGAIVSLDHGMTNLKASSFFKECGIENYSSRTCDNMCLSIMDSCISEWLNAEAMGDVSGLLSVSFLHGFVQDHCRCPMFFNRLIYEVSMKFIEDSVDKTHIPSSLGNATCSAVVCEMKDIVFTVDNIIAKIKNLDSLEVDDPLAVDIYSNHTKEELSRHDLVDARCTLDTMVDVSQSLEVTDIISLVSDIEDTSCALDTMIDVSQSTEVIDIVSLVSDMQDASCTIDTLVDVSQSLEVTDIVSVVSDMQDTNCTLDTMVDVSQSLEVTDIVSVVSDIQDASCTVDSILAVSQSLEVTDIVSLVSDMQDVSCTVDTMVDVSQSLEMTNIVSLVSDIEDVVSVSKENMEKVASIVPVLGNIQELIHVTSDMENIVSVVTDLAENVARMLPEENNRHESMAIKGTSNAKRTVETSKIVDSLVSDLKELVCTASELTNSNSFPPQLLSVSVLSKQDNISHSEVSSSKNDLECSLELVNDNDYKHPSFLSVSDILKGLVKTVSRETLNNPDVSLLPYKNSNKTSVQKDYNGEYGIPMIEQPGESSKFFKQCLEITDLVDVVADIKDIVCAATQIIPTKEISQILSSLVKNVESTKKLSDKKKLMLQDSLLTLKTVDEKFNGLPDESSNIVEILLSDMKDLLSSMSQFTDICCTTENMLKSHADEATDSVSLEKDPLRKSLDSFEEVSKVLQNIVNFVSEDVSHTYTSDMECDEIDDVPMVIDFKDNVMLESTLPSYSSDSFPTLELAVFADISCDPFNELTTASFDSTSFPPMLTPCDSDVPQILHEESIDNEPPELQNETNEQTIMSIEDESSTSEDEMDTDNEVETTNFVFDRESHFSDDSYLSECSLDSNISMHCSSSESVMSEVSSCSIPCDQDKNNLNSASVNQNDSGDTVEANSQIFSCVCSLVSEMLNKLPLSNNPESEGTISRIVKSSKSDSVSSPTDNLTAEESMDDLINIMPETVNADSQNSTEIDICSGVKVYTSDISEIAPMTSISVENSKLVSETMCDSLNSVNSKIVFSQKSSDSSENVLQTVNSLDTDEPGDTPLSSNSTVVNIVEICNEPSTINTEIIVDKTVNVHTENASVNLSESVNRNVNSMELSQTPCINNDLSEVICEGRELIDVIPNVENNRSTGKRLLTYESVVSHHGLVFKDMNSADFENIQTISEDTSAFPLDKYHLASINAVAWNPNYGSHFWLFSGGQSGIARLSYVSEINREKFFKRN